LFQGDDRIGAMSEVFDKLAQARINLIAVDAVSSGKGRFGAIFWVNPEAVAKTAKLVGAK
jgi:predicted amino acid-binding ACT domain protein